MAALRYAARFVNRNPRNLEMLGIQRPSTGYEFEADKDRRSFIYKVELLQTKSHQEARLTHYRNGVVIEASTKEKAISDQLYSNTDTCASMNLGRILAARCLQAGIHFAIPGATDEQIENSKHCADWCSGIWWVRIFTAPMKPIHHVSYVPDLFSEVLVLYVSRKQTEFFKVLQQEGLELKEPAALEHSYETDRSMTWQRYPLMANRQDKLDEL